MSRVRRGLELTKKSWGLLRRHPQLLRFPLYGGAATVVFAVIVFGPSLYLIAEDEVAVGAAIAVLGVYLLSFIGFYFSVGLAAAADMVLRGGEAGVGDGLAVSRQRLPQIGGWAPLSATVGLALNALESEGAIGELIGRLLAVGWSLVTFLAVPVIALEGTGGFHTLRRSTDLFRSRWGPQVTGNVAIGAGVFLLGLGPGIILVVSGLTVWTSAAFLGALLVVLGAILIAMGLLVSKALSGVFGVALYRYARDGEAVGGFTAEEFESAVRRRGGRGAPPTATPGTI